MNSEITQRYGFNPPNFMRAVLENCQLNKHSVRRYNAVMMQFCDKCKKNHIRTYACIKELSSITVANTRISYCCACFFMVNELLRIFFDLFDALIFRKQQKA